MGSFRSTVADWNHVPTGSMIPTILIGDRIFVNKVAYDLKVPFTLTRIAEWDAPKRGDLIVFRSPVDHKRLVKRVVGLPGDHIELRGNRLILNGELAEYNPVATWIPEQLDSESRRGRLFAAERLQDEPFHSIMTTPWRTSRSSFLPVVVPEDHVFVMGDNRDESQDSRAFGFVDTHLILGRASAVAISVNPDELYKPRWHRFFRTLR